MSERLMSWATTTDYTPAMRAAIVAVKDEESAKQALCVCLQRPGMEWVLVGVQLVRNGGMGMSERLMDRATAKDHTPVKQPTILLVEDEERLRGALNSFLQRLGYEVIAVGTVAEAENCIAERGSENIAVIHTQ